MSTVIERNSADQPGAAAAPEPKAIIKIEGAEIPLPEKWAANDELLKKALRGRYQMIANATITRKRDERGLLVVTVVKRADFKGRGRRASRASQLTPFERVVAAIRESEPHTNPALALARELQLKRARGRLSTSEVARRRPEIEAAVAEGEKEIELTKQAISRIKRCRPTASDTAPAGF